MRAFSSTPPSRDQGALLLLAALLLAALCVLRGSREASAPAQDLQEKLDATQGKLGHVRESQSSLAATIAEQNTAIDSMIGEVSALRQQAGRGRGRTGRKAGRTRRARPRSWKPNKRPPGRGPRPAAAARSACCATAWSRSMSPARPTCQRRPRLGELVGCRARADYLNQIQRLRRLGRRRVKALRDEAKAAVKRMAAVRAQDRRRARRDRRQGARSRRGQRRSGGPLRRTEGGPGRTPRSDGSARVPRTGAERQPRLDLRTDRRRSGGAGPDRRSPGAADPRRERRLHLRKPGERPGRGAAGDRRPRSKPPTRSPPPPTSGAAATAPSNPRATTARARSASPCTAAASSKARSTRPAWRPGANRAPASGSPSTPTPNTPG